MQFSPTMELTVVALLIILAVVLPLYARRRRYPVPPGPRGLPIFGNIFDIPGQQEWITYRKWSRDYG